MVINGFDKNSKRKLWKNIWNRSWNKPHKQNEDYRQLSHLSFGHESYPISIGLVLLIKIFIGKLLNWLKIKNIISILVVKCILNEYWCSKHWEDFFGACLYHFFPETLSRTAVFHHPPLLRLYFHLDSWPSKELWMYALSKLISFTFLDTSKHWFHSTKIHELKRIRSKFCWKSNCKPVNQYQ